MAFNRQPIYIKGEIALIARYVKSDGSVEIADIHNPSDGWTDWTTWNCALWINNEPSIYNIASVCDTYTDFLWEMQAMCGFYSTPEGADYGEANYEEMYELIKDIKEPVEYY